jgi:hypothetical protein
VEGEVLDLYEVDDAAGPVVTPSGDRAPEWSVRPLGSIDAPDGGIWLNDGAEGWMRGWSRLAGDGPGRLRLVPGDGPIWYWPAALVLLADAVALGTVVVLVLRKRSSRADEDYGE